MPTEQTATVKPGITEGRITLANGTHAYGYRKAARYPDGTVVAYTAKINTSSPVFRKTTAKQAATFEVGSFSLYGNPE